VQPVRSCSRGAGRGDFETHCRVTGVNRPEHLITSHCKPWRDSDNAERLDGENGLLLAHEGRAHAPELDFLTLKQQLAAASSKRP
jgi:hypothetical protein